MKPAPSEVSSWSTCVCSVRRKDPNVKIQIIWHTRYILNWLDWLESFLFLSGVLFSYLCKLNEFRPDKTSGSVHILISQPAGFFPSSSSVFYSRFWQVLPPVDQENCDTIVRSNTPPEQSLAVDVQTFNHLDTTTTWLVQKIMFWLKTQLENVPTSHEHIIGVTFTDVETLPPTCGDLAVTPPPPSTSWRESRLLKQKYWRMKVLSHPGPANSRFCITVNWTCFSLFPTHTHTHTHTHSLQLHS